MDITVISDTHQRHEFVAVPKGDLLIHCGDWTNTGAPDEMDKFLTWFTSQPHKYKVFIAGNHELTLGYGSKYRAYALDLVKDYTKKENVYFLEDSSVTIEGVKIYGSPTTPFFYDWAFNVERGPEIAEEWEKIPLDINILITHGPAYGILDLVQDTKENKGRDLHQGCEDLAKKLSELTKLKAHVFGHLHTNGGMSTTIDGVIHANAAICTEQYKPSNLPVVFTL